MCGIHHFYSINSFRNARIANFFSSLWTWKYGEADFFRYLDIVPWISFNIIEECCTCWIMIPFFVPVWPAGECVACVPVLCRYGRLHDTAHQYLCIYCTQVHTVKCVVCRLSFTFYFYIQNIVIVWRVLRIAVHKNTACMLWYPFNDMWDSRQVDERCVSSDWGFWHCCMCEKKKLEYVRREIREWERERGKNQRNEMWTRQPCHACIHEFLLNYI